MIPKRSSDVAADHRHAKGPAGLGHAPYAPLQLVIDLWILGIAEVQAVGQCHGGGPGTGQVAANLRHHDLAAPVRVQVTVPAVSIDA